LCNLYNNNINFIIPFPKLKSDGEYYFKNMGRKVRSDIKVGTLEKKLGLEPGAIRNADGSDARSDKKLATLRKEFKKKGKKIKTNPSISAKSIAKATKAVNALFKKPTQKSKKK
jgi:hypothetical protein